MSGLLNTELGDLAVSAFYYGAQGVYTSGLEPLGAPILEVATTRSRKLTEEVVEGSVSELVLLEVDADALFEGVAANRCTELLQHRTSLGVGDAIEVHLDVFEVANFGNNRVGRRQLVLGISPGLLAECEGRPGVFPLRGLGNGEVRNILGERLV